MNEHINSLPPRVILYGGTGQAKVVRPIVEHYGTKVVAVIDDTPGLPSPFPDVPIYEGWQEFLRWLEMQDRKDLGFCVTIGNPHGRARLKIHERLEAEGLIPATVIHPTAWVEKNAGVGAGCQILAGAIIAAHASLGKQCIINNNAVVEHEVVLDDAVEIATSSTVMGLTRIGMNTLVGAHSIVLSRLSIGRDVIIPAGAVIDQNIADSTTITGKSSRTH